MSHDFGLWGGLGEEGEADLPSGGVGAKLVEVVEGLGLEGLVGG